MPDAPRSSTRSRSTATAATRRPGAASGQPYEAPALHPRRAAAVPYAELHCHTNFSFLDGASHPEELAEEAARLGLTALAVTDHDGFYGVVRFSEAARELDLPTVFGAELSLGPARPAERRARPGRAGTCWCWPAAPRGTPGWPAPSPRRSSPAGRRAARSTAPGGGRRGAARTTCWCSPAAARAPCPRRCATGGRRPPRRAELDRLVALFGREQRGGGADRPRRPVRRRPQRRARRAGRSGAGCRPSPPTTCTTPRPARRRLATALAAVRARRSLDEIDGWLPAAGHRPPAQRRRDGARGSRPTRARWHERRELRPRSSPSTCNLVAPKLPDYPIPSRAHRDELAARADHARARGSGTARREAHPEAYAQIEHELEMIEELGFPGYFLVVYDIVEFCRRQRTSTARAGARRPTRRSATRCGITNVDAVRARAALRAVPRPGAGRAARHRRGHRVRPARGGHPVRLRASTAGSTPPRSPTSSRTGRGRRCATWPRRSASRPGQQDAWSKQIDRWGSGRRRSTSTTSRSTSSTFANELQTFPRHLGIHSGGMVICDRPIIEVCPVEWAPDAGPHGAAVGQGRLRGDRAGQVRPARARHALGAALRVRHDRRRPGPRQHARWTTPRSTTMLCRADSVGVFQVESRAQMATLPRLKPRDVLRPGGRGGADPARARSRAARCTRSSAARTGMEESTVPHPLMAQRAGARPSACRCSRSSSCSWPSTSPASTPPEADQLRRAMGSKRSMEKMARAQGPALRRDGRATASPASWPTTSSSSSSAFANYGFPESHAMSFAYLVYASAWLKRYHPAAFCAALLNAQPMGFYSPQSLVDDARRHGVEVRRPDINLSDAKADAGVHRADTGRVQRAGRAAARTGGCGGPAVRLGLSSVRTLGDDLAERIEEERAAHGPYRGHGRPGPAGRPDHRAPGGAGHRRRLRRLRPDPARGAVGGGRRGAGAGPTGCRARSPAPTRRPCPAWTTVDALVADVWATGLSPDSHPAQFVRDAARPGRRAADRAAGRGRARAPGCGSAASSPTGSGRRPRAGSRSSTSRTRPACSTSPARRGCGSATGGWPAPARR